MRLTYLEGENVLRLTAFRVAWRPEDHAIILTGENKAGKSSVCNALELLFGGKNARRFPAPLKRGAEKGHVLAKLDGVNLVVRKDLGPNGKEELSILDADDFAGARPKRSPQALCDAWFSTMVDPTAWLDWDDAKRWAVLKDMLGLDFAALDARRKEAYDQRTILGRELKQLQGQHKGLGLDPNAPSEPVDVKALLTAQAEAEQLNAERATRVADMHRAAEAVQRAEVAVQRLREELASAERTLEEAHALFGQARQGVAYCGEPFDMAPIRQRLGEAEEINSRYRKQQERAAVAHAVAAKETELQALSGQIAGIDLQKETAYAAADWPLPGMSYDEESGQLLLNRVPFAQASDAESIRVSVAIAIALDRRQHPPDPQTREEPDRLKIALLRRASMLDGNSRSIVIEMLSEAGYQDMLEVATTNEDAARLILAEGVPVMYLEEGTMRPVKGTEPRKDE